MICVQRISSVLRCAFCHDDADVPLWACERCATRLHVDCFELLGLCPILGCTPRRRVIVHPVVAFDGATPWHLGAWLATFAGVWVTVAWFAPKVTKIGSTRM